MADNLNSDQVDNLNDALRESRNLTKLISSNFAALEKAIGKVGNGSKKIVDNLSEYAKALSKTASLSDKLAAGRLKEIDIIKQKKALEEKYNKFVEESNKTRLISATKLAQEVKKGNDRQLSRAKQIERAEEKLIDLQSRLEREKANKINANNAIDKQAAKDKAKALRQEIAEQNKGLTAVIDIYNTAEKELIVKRQQLEKVKETNKANKELRAIYEEQIKDLKVLEAALAEQNTYGYALKKIYEDIGDKINNALKPIALLTTAFEFLKKVAFATSDQVTKLQKSLVLTKDEAYAVRDNFQAMANASEDAFITTSKLLEANAALGKQLGFEKQFGADLNTEFVRLTKQLGLSEEAAGGLAKLSVATGRTLKDTKNAAYGTVQALSSQYGIQLKQQDILEEVGKVSGQTLAMFKASPEALTQAVAQARLLGTTLEQTKKQASSLLNFETSIENELQAELLTGEQLNLERARAAALIGDQATVMSELASQNMDFNKFSNMNVIAQDKFAAALGLTSDELSDQLLKQQYIGMSQEQVVALAGEEVAKRVEAINAQDDFNAAMEKLQDIVGTLVAGPLGKFVDLLASAASSAFVLGGVLTAVSAVSLIKLTSSVLSLSTALATSAAGAGALAAFTNPLALAAGIAGVAVVGGLVASAMSSAADSATEAKDMFSSNGKTLISPKEGGLFSLSDNDEFAAAPGLGDIISRGSTQSTTTQDNSEILSKFDALIAKMENVSSGIGQLNSKEGKVYMGSQQVGTAQLMSNYNLA